MNNKPMFYIAISPGLKVSSEVAEEIVYKHIKPMVMQLAEDVGDYELTGKVLLGAVNACIARNKKSVSRQHQVGIV